MKYSYLVFVSYLIVSNVAAAPMKSDTTVDEFIAYGKAKLINKEYEESIGFFSKALQLNPSSGVAFRHKGEAESMLKQFDKSIESYKQSLKINPNDTLALIGKADANRLSKKFEDALVDFDAVIKLIPNNPNLRFGRGSVFLSLNRYKEALPDFSISISAFPAFKVLQYDRGLIYYHLGKYKESIEDLRKYLPHHTNQSLSPFFLMGISFKNLDQLDSAIKYFTMHVSIKKADADGYISLADCYSRRLNFIAVDSLLEKIETLEFDKLKWFTNRAGIEINLKRYEKAWSYLQKAKELGDDSKEFYRNQGIAKLGMKDTVSAIQSFSKAISLDPNYKDAYVSRLEVYLFRNQTLPLAIQDLNAVIRLDSVSITNYVNYFFRALCYARLNNVKAAYADVEKGFILSPSKAYSYIMRAIIRIALKEPTDKIMSDLSMTIKSDSNFWQAYLIRAEQFADKKQYKKACKDLNKAVSLGGSVTQEIRDFICSGVLKNGVRPPINFKIDPS
ncbi:MAG: tetratricopeptide repeat protein [Cyclobacteriaceae bacterium]|nr:tetratricopeptide repeat protein [Cyclobacteriaceae bacterium]